MTLPPHAAPYALPMSLIEEEVDANRFDACPSYERCLDHALAEDWQSWSCSCCTHWPERSGKRFVFSRADVPDDEGVVAIMQNKQTKPKKVQSVGEQLDSLGWKLYYTKFRTHGDRRLTIAYNRGAVPGLELYTFAIRSVKDRFSKKAAHAAILRRIQSDQVYEVFAADDADFYFDLCDASHQTPSEIMLHMSIETDLTGRGWKHSESEG